MTTTEANGTAALAVNPQLSDKQIRTRLEVAQQAGYGLEQATPAQLNIVYLVCQRYKLDPLFHVTLYRGRPWVTIDGRIELAKRHPEYRGFRTRPLSKDEKEAWDYRPEDLVVECSIDTLHWGTVTSRGKVSAEERGKNTPTGTNPQEMAEKRAIARAARLAFGQSAYLDEDEADQERTDRAVPEQIAQNAARYDEVFASDADRDMEGIPMEVEATTGEVLGDELSLAEQAVCVQCKRPVLDQLGRPLNDNQRELVLQRFGSLLCRDCRKATP